MNSLGRQAVQRCAGMLSAYGTGAGSRLIRHKPGTKMCDKGRDFGMMGRYITFPVTTHKGTTHRHQLVPKRAFYKKWLARVWNQVDKDRIKMIGPDRAAAEWIIKNGGAVKFTGSASFSNDYDDIMRDITKPRYITAFEAVDSGIYWIGFEYLKGLSHLQSIRFSSCPEIDDVAIDKLEVTSNSLTDITIENCPITSASAPYFAKLKNLKSCTVRQCSKIGDAGSFKSTLTGALPNCRVIVE